MLVLKETVSGNQEKLGSLYLNTSVGQIDKAHITYLRRPQFESQQGDLCCSVPLSRPSTIQKKKAKMPEKS